MQLPAVENTLYPILQLQMLVKYMDMHVKRFVKKQIKGMIQIFSGVREMNKEIFLNVERLSLV